MEFTWESEQYNWDVISNHSHPSLFSLSFLGYLGWSVYLFISFSCTSVFQHLGLEILGLKRQGTINVELNWGESCWPILPQAAAVS